MLVNQIILFKYLFKTFTIITKSRSLHYIVVRFLKLVAVFKVNKNKCAYKYILFVKLPTLQNTIIHEPQMQLKHTALRNPVFSLKAPPHPRKATTTVMLPARQRRQLGSKINSTK